jgi:bacillithiol biosynthesis cysteine-adding enzyme BshC
MITTGQQAGLLTGPMYTIHKAITAARLAADLERELDTIVLPVFWVASEDHDWDEVNHAYLLGSDDHVHRVQLDSADARALPMSHRALDASIRTVIDECAHVSSGQRFSDCCLSLFREYYREDQTVAAAFGDMMIRLLAPFDMLVTDAADPDLKQASADVLATALIRADEAGKLIADRTDALEAAGYHGQVAVLEGGTNVFFSGTGERERLDLKGDGLAAESSGLTIAGGEVRDQVVAEPGHFSPNVLLRPVVESHVFPTLAYVGGPGEMSYFAQVGPLFGLHGILPPVVFPRVSVLLVEPAIARLMGKLGMEIDELSAPRHELIERLARGAMPGAAVAALGQLSEEIITAYGKLMEAGAGIDQSLVGALGALRNQSLAHAQRAERKILRRIKAVDEIRASQLDRARAHLMPGGEPQERVLSVFSYLARHGPELLTRIYESIETTWEAKVA